MLRRTLARRRPRGAGSSPAPDSPAKCEHLAAAASSPGEVPATPDARGCAECADLGENTWAHLRVCLTCGHVGCCDSSPHQHATEHFHRTGHPVMRSAEPNESWRWCYLDHRIG